MRRYISILAVCMLAACSQKNDPQAEELQRKIRSAFRSGATQVQFSELTNFDWDQVCHLDGSDDSFDPPYVHKFITARGMTSAIDTSSFLMDIGLKEESYEDAFIFSKENVVVRVIRIFSRDPNTFIDEQEQCIDSKSAVFAFDKRVLPGGERLAISFKRKED